MKIKLSKAQWLQMGKTAGWLKTAEEMPSQDELKRAIKAAAAMWKAGDENGAIASLKKYDPNITVEGVKQLLAKEPSYVPGGVKSGAIGWVKEAGISSNFIANLFVSTLLGVGIMGQAKQTMPDFYQGPQVGQSQEAQGIDWKTIEKDISTGKVNRYNINLVIDQYGMDEQDQARIMSILKSNTKGRPPV